MILQMGKSSVFARAMTTLVKSSSSLRTTPSLSPYCFLGIENYRDCCRFSWSSRTLTENRIFVRRFNSSDSSHKTIDKLTFDNVCAETLESLSEYFEELIESIPHLKNADVTYSDGVLTVHFGQKFGTYVINRQTPNLQIWLSSPTSGPKRYDFMCGTWIYKHDQTTLHSLLDEEIKDIANKEVEFTEKCLHAKVTE